MGIILSALAAAGDAGVQSINQNIGQQNQLDLMAQQHKNTQELDVQRSALEEQKQRAIMQAKADIDNAPMKRAGELVRQSAQGEVMDQVPDPTETNGDYVDKDGVLRKTGVHGSFAKMRADVMAATNLSPDDRAYALSQIDKQYESAVDLAQAGNAPRMRSPAEAMADASQKALANGDLQAFGALKTAAGDKFITVPDGANLFDSTTGKQILTGTGKADRQIVHEDAADARQQARLDAQLALEDKRAQSKASAKRAAADPWGVFTDPEGEPIRNLPHGDEFLKMLPPQAQEQVKALSEGRLSFPTGAAMRSDAAQNLVSAVAQYDPSFDAVNFGARSATRKGFTSGKEAQSINAINTVMKHLDEYIKAGDELNNGSSRMINSVVNGVQSSFGDPRRTRFDTTRNAVVDEVEKAYRGSGGSQAGIDAWKENMSSSQSPEQIKASGQQLIRLLEGKIEALGDQYSKGMGVTKNGLELLSPGAQSVYNKIMADSKPQTSATQPGESGLPTGWSVKVH